MKNKEFRLLGLTQEQHEFLYQYAQNQLGCKSRTKAVLHLIKQAMNENGDISAYNGDLNPVSYPNTETMPEAPYSANESHIDTQKPTKRIQFSILAQDYAKLAQICAQTDSSIQHFLRCMLKSTLNQQHELLGAELEQKN